MCLPSTNIQNLNMKGNENVDNNVFRNKVFGYRYDTFRMLWCGNDIFAWTRREKESNPKRIIAFLLGTIKKSETESTVFKMTQSYIYERQILRLIFLYLVGWLAIFFSNSFFFTSFGLFFFPFFVFMVFVFYFFSLMSMM